MQNQQIFPKVNTACVRRHIERLQADSTTSCWSGAFCRTLLGVDAVSTQTHCTVEHNKEGLNWTARSRELPVTHRGKQFGSPQLKMGRQFTPKCRVCPHTIIVELSLFLSGGFAQRHTLAFGTLKDGLRWKPLCQSRK